MREWRNVNFGWPNIKVKRSDCDSLFNVVATSLVLHNNPVHKITKDQSFVNLFFISWGKLMSKFTFNFFLEVKVEFLLIWLPNCIRAFSGNSFLRFTFSQICDERTRHDSYKFMSLTVPSHFWEGRDSRNAKSHMVPPQ